MQAALGGSRYAVPTMALDEQPRENYLQLLTDQSVNN
jgi:hypothetical protein